VRTVDPVAIPALLPHRYPFLLVDRIEVPEPGRRVVGYKRFAGAEWAALGPGEPAPGGVVLGTAPGPSGLLVVEALAQTSAALLADLVASTAGAVGYFAAFERVRLRVPPRPGDEVRLAVTLRAFRRGIAQLAGVADVGGRVVASARFTTVVRARAG
jgi:3-hydroxyacyl-[acyl-carrier-protein] dehydratase